MIYFQDRMDAVVVVVVEILWLSEDMYAFDIIPVGYLVKEVGMQDRFDEGKVHYVK